MAMPDTLDIGSAAAALRNGAVLAYPTEAVFGLGCDPFDEAAVLRLLDIKQRAVDKGVILVAARIGQFGALLDWNALAAEKAQRVRDTWPGPHTWIVPATPGVPRWITGAHDAVAVRVSAHPVVVALCEAFAGPLVSTSANRARQPPARSVDTLDAALRARIDGIVAGEVGALAAPTPIRDAATGAVLRA